MERVEVFDFEGRRFMHFDLSGIGDNDEFERLLLYAKEQICGYPEKSVYTITNIRDISFDSATKELAANWMEHNGPYVIAGAVVGMDGVRKMMAKAVFTLANRDGLIFASTKERALEMFAQKWRDDETDGDGK